jgi:signal transduction histidine kinase
MVEVTLANPDADSAALRRMGERVLASCVRQQRLIDGLLELAGSGRGLMRHEPVDLAAVTVAALRAHDLSEHESRVALERARTDGDADLLERLAANLISNAVCHNVIGGLIEVETHAASGRAVLRVANTGPLIPPAELQRLFQPFQRFESHQTKAPQGLGLGLAVVRAIADAHDAVVAPRARPGGGLEIRVTFRAVQ